MKSKMVSFLRGAVLVVGVLTALFFVYSYNNGPLVSVYSGVSAEQMPPPTLYREDDLLQELEILRAEIERMRTRNEVKGGGVSYHGQLRLYGTQLVNQFGEPIQLRGMSSHGITWYPEFTNFGAIRTLRERGANMFRIAMYSYQNQGFVHYPDASMQFMLLALENVLAADMYAIVDWHILRDYNPNMFRDEAIFFFEEISRRYAGHPGIIFEIANEPNGPTTWDDIIEYAMEVIPVIRRNSPDAIIIVGTPNFSVNIEYPAANPLPFDNIMYAFHFYTGYSQGGYVRRIESAIEAGIGIFVSEWGLSYEPGENFPCFDKAQDFLDFVNMHYLSWAAWSLSNKNEVFSAIHYTSMSLSDWQDYELTDVGRFLFDALGGK